MRILLAIGLVAALAAPLPAAALSPTAAAEREHYTVESLAIPADLTLEVSGIVELPGPGDRLAVCTRRGDVYLVDGAFGPAEKVTYKLFASGLHEPLGINEKDGWLYVTHRPEVMRMKDADGDGRADRFEVVAGGWGISGDYHEYAFGSPFDRAGNIWVVLCLTGSKTSKAPFRGWAMRITPDGRAIPTACGIRSPGGVGFNAEGDAFYTDNQGFWNGSSSLKHLKIGSFQGDPVGNESFALTDAIGPRPPEPQDNTRVESQRRRIPTFVPPAVVMPHARLGRSPTGIVHDATGRFGPFVNHLLVGEQNKAAVQRVFLEKVNGVYQGAVWPFLEGFDSGNIALLMTKRGVLFTGGSARGWGSIGGKPFNFQRVTWKGTTGFDASEMRAKADGFELTFTQPVDRKSAGDPASYAMEAYTYAYRAEYGGPEVDKVTPRITRAAVAADGLSVRLTVDPLTKGHVHELHMEAVRSAAGRPLLHPVGYYTLNEVPE